MTRRANTCIRHFWRGYASWLVQHTLGDPRGGIRGGFDVNSRRSTSFDIVFYSNRFWVSNRLLSKTSAGVLHPRHLRGVELRRWQIDLKYRFVSFVGWVERGRCVRNRLLVFSAVPFCHGDWGSRNQRSAPVPSLSCCQAANSVPRSKVIALRASAGKGTSTAISASKIGWIDDLHCASPRSIG
jgi:hypothetical protein